ncbi:CNNM domain-containing protein [Mycoplasmopsis synoviae]|uniref:CNNM domain-containing protein n=1 Tax=Mycoplasmopsis synoviae TaxID=2109 RepID=UPI0034DAF2EB
METTTEPSHLGIGIKITIFIIIFILFLLSSIFSGSETAYSTIPATQIQELNDKKTRFGNLIKKQLLRYNQILSTVLIANNLVNVASSVLTSFIIGSFFANDDDPLVLIISTLVVTPILVIFGEILPKLFAKKKPKLFLLLFSPFIEVLYYFFFVLTYPIRKFSKQSDHTHSEDDIKKILELANSEGILDTKEKILAQKALDLNSTKINKHYIRLKNVVYLDSSLSVNKALETFKETNYSRMPVKKDKNFIGIVLLKDLIFSQNKSLLSLVKMVPSISIHSSLAKGLEIMKQNQIQMLFVTQNNSSNQVIGIITLEDILEEVVGEIYDEYDQEEIKEIHEISWEKSLVKASTLMDAIFKQLELNLELLSDEEKEMSLYDFIVSKSEDNSFKTNLKIYLDNKKISFKVLKLNQKNKAKTLVEIEKL